MAVFVDTSGVLAVLDDDDPNHRRAAAAWAGFRDTGEQLITSNYIVAESLAVVARRLGFPWVRSFCESVLPVMEVIWVDQDLHNRAMAVLLAAGRRQLSFVDCTSFEVMRDRGVDTVFAVDADFVRQGFRCIP